MFAIDHAATALLVKRRFPSVPMAPILISVQAMELAWVALNYLGVERTTTEATVRSVADIHLAYIPWSHSVGTASARRAGRLADHREGIWPRGPGTGRGAGNRVPSDPRSAHPRP